MRFKFCVQELSEEINQEIALLVNGAYNDGLHGIGGYPISADLQLQKFAEVYGISFERVKDNKLLLILIGLINCSYVRGRRDAV